MVHASFWFMLTMSIYLVEAYILLKKHTNYISVAGKEPSLEENAEITKHTFRSKKHLLDEFRP